ncbi:MAG: glycosyltransferase family 4 protein [Salinibacterium sp.]|nr:glycosyltransferase family 4 protein [Salinibacterium sp.]
MSRIFSPEPSAASFMLESIARVCRDAGHDVEVVTTRAPSRLVPREIPGVRVRRAPVLRDASGYVRGYLQYMSFDIPLFFRLLFGRRGDVYIVEPPPTTGAVVRIVTALRRRPYVYDAADVWSDAAAMATRSRFVLSALRAVEVWAWRGAKHVVTISEGVRERMRQLGSESDTSVLGFGVDLTAFDYAPMAPGGDGAPYFVYAGTYSEWHGADIFVDAFARFRAAHPDFRMIFVGNGSEKANLEAKAAELGLGQSVQFLDAVAPEELSSVLAGAQASLASLKPGQGYDYAFTTKLYSSVAAGCPVIFTGVGPTASFIRDHVGEQPLGVAVDYDADAVAEAMHSYAESPLQPERRAALSEWSRERYSLDSIAQRVMAIAENVGVVGVPKGH